MATTHSRRKRTAGELNEDRILYREGRRRCTTCLTIKPLADYDELPVGHPHARLLLDRRYVQTHDTRCRECKRHAGNARRHKRRLHYTTGDFPSNGMQMLLAEYGAACMKCGRTESIELDHIVPISLGGPHSLSNAQLLCQPCNGSKGNRNSTDYRPYVVWK
ncbi:HNH endonuclease [Nocardioides abyssi]|uniref:HNH endonuclease n=1 Tax=Nocardioides abyssi TaxID=3058370 RepID=UPI0034E00957